MMGVVTREQVRAVIADYYPLWEAKHGRPAAPKPAAPAAAPTPTPTPKAGRASRDKPDNRVRRCRAYLRTVPPSVEGSHGSNRIYQAARIIWNDFGIDEADGYPLLDEFNRNSVPVWVEEGSQGLLRKWREAVKKGPGPEGRGYKLADRPDHSPPGRRGSGSSDGTAPPAEPPGGAAAAGGGAGPRNEESFDPFRLGRMLVPTRDGVPTMLYHRGEWWRWAGGRYDTVSDDDVRTEAWVVVRAECERMYAAAVARWERGGREGKAPTVPKVENKVVSHAVLAAAAMCHVPEGVTWPVMLAAGPAGPGELPRLDPDPEVREFLAVANGLIDVGELLAAGSTALRPPTPLYFTPAALPVAFDPAADCPRFLAFLDRVAEGDAGRRAVLQELVGYLLRFDQSQQAFFVLTGEGGNGKSTFLAAVRALLGDHNISAVPLEMFGERFQLTPTLGKLVNAVAEVGEMDKVAEAVLKSFTAGDLMTFDRKNKAPVQARPTARLLLSCNVLPRFTDRTEGVWRRYQVVPFAAQIGDAEKVRGMDRPEWWAASGELPGMLNWALAGLHRLHRRGGFTASAACDAAKAKHRELCNPHRQYLEDHCMAAANGRVPCGELFAAYAEWCRQRRYRPMSDGNFGDEVRRVFRGVDRTRPKIGGVRTYVYEGIAWSDGRPDDLLREFDARRGVRGPGIDDDDDA